jgi:hypothetical protein
VTRPALVDEHVGDRQVHDRVVAIEFAQPIDRVEGALLLVAEETPHDEQARIAGDQVLDRRLPLLAQRVADLALGEQHLAPDLRLVLLPLALAVSLGAGRERFGLVVVLRLQAGKRREGDDDGGEGTLNGHVGVQQRDLPDGVEPEDPTEVGAGSNPVLGSREAP